MKIIKTLGALSILSAPLTTVISCSGDPVEKNDHLFEAFQLAAGGSNDEARKNNSAHMNYIYNNYVTADNYLDYTAIDDAGYKGISQLTGNNSFSDILTISDLNDRLDEQANGDDDFFYDTHDFELFKIHMTDVNKHLNGEFINLNINNEKKDLYNNLAWENEYIRWNNDFDESFNMEIPGAIWGTNLPVELFHDSQNIGGAIIGENITRIPRGLFNHVHWSNTHPIQFEDPSNIMIVESESMRMSYPSRTRNFDLTNFTSIERIEEYAFSVDLDNADEEDFEWTESQKSILKLPKRDITIEEHSFHDSPIKEVHYYSEFHTVYDSDNVESDHFSKIIGGYTPAYYPGDTPIDGGVLFVDLSDPANASYLPT